MPAKNAQRLKQRKGNGQEGGFKSDEVELEKDHWNEKRGKWGNTVGGGSVFPFGPEGRQWTLEKSILFLLEGKGDGRGVESWHSSYAWKKGAKEKEVTGRRKTKRWGTFQERIKCPRSRSVPLKGRMGVRPQEVGVQLEDGLRSKRKKMGGKDSRKFVVGYTTRMREKNQGNR